MITKRDWLLAAIIAVVVFAATYRLAATKSHSDWAGALRQVASDTAGGVCLSDQACLTLGASNTLFIFFKEGDCPPSLYDTVILEGLFQETPRARLNVVGVVDGMSVAQAHRFAIASGITYPLYTNTYGLSRLVSTPRQGSGNLAQKVLVSNRGVVVKAWSSVASVPELLDDAARIRTLVMNGRL